LREKGGVESEESSMLGEARYVEERGEIDFIKVHSGSGVRREWELGRLLEP